MCDDTVVSRRRRRRATVASSDFFCVPFGGGRQRERLYTSDSLFDDGGPCASTQTAPTAPTAPGLRLARACVPRPPPPMAICTKDCIATPSYASDGDCDGDGPGAEYLG